MRNDLFGLFFCNSIRLASILLKNLIIRWIWKKE
jgi:hypothetical protein